MLIKNRDLGLHADLLGDAADPVVCLLHPLASDSGVWAPQIKAILQRGFRCLRMDFRGHGGTPFGPEAVTLDVLVDDAHGVIDALGLSQVHLVGLSVGGVVAQGLALKYGDRFKSLALSDCLSESVPQAKPVWQERQAAVRKLGGLAQMADGMLSKWVDESFAQRDPATWKALRGTLAATSVEGFCAMADIMQDFGFADALPSLKLPTLVMCGQDDELSPPPLVRRIADLVPGARFELIEGGKHFPNVDKAERFNELLLAWLDTVR